MPVGSVTSVIGARGVPDAVLARCALPAIDYADRFTLATDVVATPEQWARTMFGDVPSAAEQCIWRGVLGFRLSRGRSPATVGGWRIDGRGEDWIRLRTASWFLSGAMLIETAGGQVCWTTAVHHDRPVAAVVWPPASVVHRRLVPRVLLGAEGRLRARR